MDAAELADMLDGFVAQAIEQLTACVVELTHAHIEASGERDYLDGSDLTGIHAFVAGILTSYRWRPPAAAELDRLIAAACQRHGIKVVL